MADTWARTYLTLQGQTIFDIAVQTQGDVQRIDKLISQFQDIGLNQAVPVGTQIGFNPVTDPIATFFETRSIVSGNETEDLLVIQAKDIFDDTFDDSFQ